jgi:hypothetical protein
LNWFRVSSVTSTASHSRLSHRKLLLQRLSFSDSLSSLHIHILAAVVLLFTTTLLAVTQANKVKQCYIIKYDICKHYIIKCDLSESSIKYHNMIYHSELQKEIISCIVSLWLVYIAYLNSALLSNT